MNSTSKAATPLTHITILFIAVFLSIGATPSHAGLLGTIDNKVDTVINKVDKVNNKVTTAVANTNGVQDLVTNVKGVTSGFRPGVFEDLQASLGEVQDMIEFLKAFSDNAGSPADYPDVLILITSLESIISVLQDTPGSNLDPGILPQLIQVLPDRLLAVLGQALTKAGIDAAFVDRLNQMALDLAMLSDAIKQDDAEQAVAMQQFQSATLVMAPVPGTDPLPSPTSCDFFNNRRAALKLAAAGVLTVGGYLRLSGKLLDGTAKTVQTDVEVGIHGYTGTAIKTDPLGAVGKIMAGIGAVTMAISATTYNRLRHCEILYHQQEILVGQQNVLDSNQVLLQEICELKRYNSGNCQVFLP